MIQLVAVNKDNWQECIRLPTSEDHARFVARNVYSIAESQFYPETVTACCIFAGRDMVGFAMYGPDEDDATLFAIDRLMIAEGHRGKGYGKAALSAILVEAQRRGFSRIKLSTNPENVKAIKLYERVGFRATGEMDDDEAVYVYTAEMARLTPMTEREFEAFMELSMKDQAQGQVQAGVWRAEDAAANIEKLRSQFLPNGLTTPNHYFFVIADAGTDTQVGSLWYSVEEEEGKRQVFVVDIQIDEAYRRQGYGSQAFRIMEEKAQEMGISTIALHVFEHNRAARAMYEKLGYTGTGSMMSKKID
jgi:RimJ/RimL family protein N-acetyltransferase